MKILQKGYRYILDNVDLDQGQVVQFYEGEDAAWGPNTAVNGCTNTEYLLPLLHRLESRFSHLPSQELEQAIINIKQALMWLQRIDSNEGNPTTPTGHR